MERKSWLEGPRWAFSSSVLLKLAIELNLSINIDKEEVGWFTKIIFYTIKGEEKNINNFKYSISKAVENYNRA